MQAQQEANMLGLQEQKNMPGMATEELNDQAMAMGAKMAGFDWLGLGVKMAGLGSIAGKMISVALPAVWALGR